METATPHGCNIEIDGIGSPWVWLIFILSNSASKRRSHNHRHYTPPTLHDVSLNDLLIKSMQPFVQSSWILPITDFANMLTFWAESFQDLSAIFISVSINVYHTYIVTITGFTIYLRTPSRKNFIVTWMHSFPLIILWFMHQNVRNS